MALDIIICCAYRSDTYEVSGNKVAPTSNVNVKSFEIPFSKFGHYELHML